jgi:type II secretory pathway pseudopilin PulG
MELLLAIVVVAIVAAYVAGPLRRRPDRGSEDRREDPLLADLQARKQAKYREIRDTELDHAQGKLDEREFRRQEAELKREAIEILKLIDAHESKGGSASPAATDGPGPRSG